MGRLLQQGVRTFQHHWLTISFVLGFFTDLLLLNRIDDLVDNLILLFYVLLATASMLLFYVGVAEWGPVWWSRFLRRYTTIAMQYAFGGLLSGMLIFYGRSGDWLASAPFLLLIVSVVIGNELVRKRSDRLVYHLGLYFIGLYSYVVLVVPVISGRMGDSIFILSGLIAVLVVSFVVQVLFRIIPRFMALQTTRIIVTIGAIYIGFNSLYFTGLIPPIPLSLTELAIVQSVETYDSGTGLKGYRVTVEEQPWYRQLPFARPILHPTGGSIACFARVFAPARLSTDIYHQWEYKDASGRWQLAATIPYSVSGTNQAGYGGYSKITSFSSGVWRCSVETGRGQVLGREVVRVDTTLPPQNVETQLR